MLMSVGGWTEALSTISEISIHVIICIKIWGRDLIQLFLSSSSKPLQTQ